MLTPSQRAKLIQLGSTAHEQRMRVVGLLRVKDEMVRFKHSLTRSIGDAQKAVGQLLPEFRSLEAVHKRGQMSPEEFEHYAAPFSKAQSTLRDLESQMSQTRAELERLEQRISEANASSAPSRELLNRVLQHARVRREDLGIAFEDGQ